jgi:hypothetical protein
MSRRAARVLWFGLGVLAAQLISIGAVLATDAWEDRNR